MLKLVATTLISTVGGAAGPLYGTAFLKASGAVSDSHDLDGDAVVALLRAGRDGIVLRGKAESGDKTMVDAWTPAVDAAAAAQEAGLSPTGILAAAADAAEAGAVATEPLIARKGRASYLGERSAGHRDPGAQSTALLLRAAADTAADFA
jgi:dihydroxyacetone kinase-like protein